jgi:hypothetical protein
MEGDLEWFMNSIVDCTTFWFTMETTVRPRTIAILSEPGRLSTVIFCARTQGAGATTKRSSAGRDARLTRRRGRPRYFVNGSGTEVIS